MQTGNSDKNVANIMSFDKSGVYPKVSMVNFDDQKYQSRKQRYALIVHAYLCFAALFVISPVLKVFHHLRVKYSPENGVTLSEKIHYLNLAPEDEKDAGILRPFSAVTLSKIYDTLAYVWNLLDTPFRYVGDVLSGTDSLKLKPEDELKMAQAYFDRNK